MRRGLSILPPEITTPTRKPLTAILLLAMAATPTAPEPSTTW